MRRGHVKQKSRYAPRAWSAEDSDSLLSMCWCVRGRENVEGARVPGRQAGVRAKLKRPRLRHRATRLTFFFLRETDATTAGRPPLRGVEVEDGWVATASRNRSVWAGGDAGPACSAGSVAPGAGLPLSVQELHTQNHPEPSPRDIPPL